MTTAFLETAEEDGERFVTFLLLFGCCSVVFHGQKITLGRDDDPSHIEAALKLYQKPLDRVHQSRLEARFDENGQWKNSITCPTTIDTYLIPPPCGQNSSNTRKKTFKNCVLTVCYLLKSV